MKGRILTSLLTVIALTGLQAQNIPAVPRLVVGLTIDQLRTDWFQAVVERRTDLSECRI